MNDTEKQGSSSTEENLPTNWRSIEKYLSLLPSCEREVFYLHYYRSMKQRDIARYVDMSQGGVCHSIKKARKRLFYLKELETKREESLDEIKELCDPLELEIVDALTETSTQTETAVRINELFALEGARKMNQVKIKYKLGIIRQRARLLNLTKAEDFMTFIMENLYMRRQVIIPASKGKWI